MAGKFGRYFLTGGSAAVVDLGVFALIEPRTSSVAVAAASSFAVAAVVNYVLTSFFVFRQQLSLEKWLKFFAFALVGLAVNVAVTSLCAEVLHIQPIYAKVAGIGVAFMLNFTLNLTLVFRARPGP